LNVSALAIRIIQKFFAGFLDQRTTGGDGPSKSTALYSAGELLTTRLFLRDGSAVVSARACPSRISCVDRIAKKRDFTLFFATHNVQRHRMYRCGQRAKIPAHLFRRQQTLSGATRPVQFGLSGH